MNSKIIYMTNILYMPQLDPNLLLFLSWIEKISAFFFIQGEVGILRGGTFLKIGVLKT